MPPVRRGKSSTVPAPRGWRRPAAIAAVALLGGCVTTYEDAPLFAPLKSQPLAANSVTIPFPELPGGEDAVALAVWNGLLSRMQDATVRGDRTELLTLLGTAERPENPEWFRQRLAGFRLVAQGLAFREHALAHTTVRLTVAEADADVGATEAPAADSAPDTLPLGAPLRCEIVLPATDTPFHIGASGDPDRIGFAVAVAIDDAFVDGSTRHTSTREFVWLPHAVELAGRNQLRLPIALDFAAGDAVRRTLTVRVDLLPGYVGVDGQLAPVQARQSGKPEESNSIAVVTANCYPIGYELVRKAPLEHLRAALRRGDRGSFATIWLAANATQGAEREPALAALIEQVRLGRPDLAFVATAALHSLAEGAAPIGDREAWLAWWQAR